jgi:competence protein ComEC
VKSKLLLSLIPIALGGAVYAYLREDPTRLVFLSVGQGDCALFSSSGVHVLVDAGPARDGYDAGKTLVVPKLRELGVDRVGLLFLTHPDSDHIGGAGAVLRRYPEAKLVVNRLFEGHPDIVRSLRQWRVSPKDVVWASGITDFRFGGSFVRCYAPPRADEDNAGSLVLQLGEGTARAVISGDAPEEEEMQAAQAADWSAQVMTAGHHGSRTSSSYAWIREVRPSVAVVSCGVDNPYGHPSDDALRRFDRAGIEVDRTDIEGDLEFLVENGRFVRRR